jgi:hypothetical protein
VAILAQAGKQRAPKHRVVFYQQQTHGVGRPRSAMNVKVSITSDQPGRRAFDTVAIVASLP